MHILIDALVTCLFSHGIDEYFPGPHFLSLFLVTFFFSHLGHEHYSPSTNATHLLCLRISTIFILFLNSVLINGDVSRLMVIHDYAIIKSVK